MFYFFFTGRRITQSLQAELKMADDKKGLIEHFATVAGVEEERARFFLEMTNWNLDVR